ncbi:methylmalonyl-CoA mutase subunit beta [Christiangramia salexigens]|uniref:Methylmalonyl-CoA mutase n=1 Tax=Christiangramia salexigens TaxID=1913577 RepID=A0A1L3J1W5_9FLAO|nr:methylmalonyl-CoA mutase subunit beta [Christiangramia salexigens]APG59109.1 methylmalonyl-CoA mutase [Christiangramia salexigens]
MKQLLFQEFEEVSAKQWKQKIQADLKGADYNEKLVTKTNHGIDIKPFYSAEDIPANLKVSNPSNWSICEKIYIEKPENALERAKQKIEKGTEALEFIIPSPEVDVRQILNSLPENIELHLHLNFLDSDYITKLNAFIKESSHVVHLQTDIIGNLAKTGNWFENLQSDHKELDKVIANSSEFASSISIDQTLYQNSGANIPQQLAYSIAHATEYLNHMDNLEVSEEFRQSFKFQFKISTGSDFFFEIAKIRALRWLYSSIAGEFNFNTNCFIYSQPTTRNKTLYDFNVNMLRTTTESMSAILGGADTIHNMPYDAIYHKNNEFGDRIARNQLLILKTESYFDKVGNVAEGSYYIESLTSQLAEKALEIFKEIEKGGGFLKQLKEGIIQRKIKESANLEQAKFDNSELVLIGTNKYENPEDRMKDDIELYPFLKRNPRKTLIEPILPKRLSEEMEKKKLQEEENQTSK